MVAKKAPTKKASPRKVTPKVAPVVEPVAPTPLLLTFKDFDRIALMAHAASDDLGRPILSTIYLEVGPTTTRVTTTNSYILAHTFLEVGTGDSSWKVLIPIKGLAETIRAFKAAAKMENSSKPFLSLTQVELLPIAGNRIRITLKTSWGDLLVANARLMEGKYPNYDALFDDSKESVAGSVGFLPSLTFDLVKTLPKNGPGYVELTLYGKTKTFELRSSADPNWRGIQMPVRL